MPSCEERGANPEKISRVKDWERPTNRKEVLQFLGFAGYYRRYVEGYSSIAAPLYRLTSGDPRKKIRGKKRLGPEPPFLWTTECEKAFQSLRQKLTTAPVLAYPGYSQPFVLQTDASGEGLGAVLAQFQGGTETVVARDVPISFFSSRSDSDVFILLPIQSRYFPILVFRYRFPISLFVLANNI